MLKKPITYKNIDGDEVTEEFYFHLTKADLVKMEMSEQGGLQKALQRIIKSGNTRKIIQTFEEIIERAFGKRTGSGNFIKRHEDWLEFQASDAYSELFMELISNASYAAEFIKSIVPSEFADKLEMDPGTSDDIDKLVEQLSAGDVKTEDVPLPDEAPIPAWIRERRDPTQRELRAMPEHELRLAMQAKLSGKFPGDEGF